MAPFGAALALAPLAAGGLLLAVQLVRLRRRRAPLLRPGLAGTTLLAFVVALVPTHALALPVDVNGLPIPNGDLNADGRLDAADALLEQQIATGRRVASAEQLDRGDIAPVNLAPKTPHAIAAGDVALLLRAIRGVDVDQDLLGTDEEMAAGSSPFRIDSDRDGLGDFEEIRVLGSSPGNADTDGDGVLDAAEVNTQGTDPTDADTDGDGFADGAEIAAGTSPLAGVVYRHGDHLGSTALVTRSDGAVLQRVVYKPYGGLSVAQGADATPRLGFYFTGQRLESSVGLYDYGARFYDPALGRFLQPDSIVPSPLSPQSLNRYAYVRNNPLRYVDPTGHFWAEMWGGVTSAGSWIGSQVGSLFSESGGGVSANPLRWPGQIVGAIGTACEAPGTCSPACSARRSPRSVRCWRRRACSCRTPAPLRSTAPAWRGISLTPASRRPASMCFGRTWRRWPTGPWLPRRESWEGWARSRRGLALDSPRGTSCPSETRCWRSHRRSPCRDTRDGEASGIRGSISAERT
jgi:RHS repeat-associated protein